MVVDQANVGVAERRRRSDLIARREASVADEQHPVVVRRRHTHRSEVLSGGAVGPNRGANDLVVQPWPRRAACRNSASAPCVPA